VPVVVPFLGQLDLILIGAVWAWVVAIPLHSLNQLRWEATPETDDQTRPAAGEPSSGLISAMLGRGQRRRRSDLVTHTRQLLYRGLGHSARGRFELDAPPPFPRGLDRRSPPRNGVDLAIRDQELDHVLDPVAEPRSSGGQMKLVQLIEP
jgi:hypothetical protein